MLNRSLILKRFAVGRFFAARACLYYLLQCKPIVRGPQVEYSLTQFTLGVCPFPIALHGLDFMAIDLGCLWDAATIAQDREQVLKCTAPRVCLAFQRLAYALVG